MDALTQLLLANLLFVGGHFVLSHPLRRPLVAAIGERGFLGAYSLFALATFVWIVVAFLKVGPGAAPLWDGTALAIWIVASLLTILALGLLLGSFRGNPALPATGAEVAQAARPVGVFRVTRHPMMWGVAIWAASHILVMPSPRTLITAGGMGVLALVGAALQDRKKERLLGDAWRGWEARTSYWPRFGALGQTGWRLWLHALAAWLLLTWLHVWLAYIPAGIWRWVG